MNNEKMTRPKSRLNRLSKGPLSSRVKVRKTNPNLWLSVMISTYANIALGLNFLLTTPTFQQFDIPKNAIGWTFLAIGLSLFVFLNFWRNLKAVRILLFVSIVFALFWGTGTTQTFFQHKSSLQLFILYSIVAAYQFRSTLEPFSNPITDKTNGEE